MIREGDQVGKLELKRWVFRCFQKDATEGKFSYLEGERVSKNWGIVTERIRKMFDLFVNSMVKVGV